MKKVSLISVVVVILLCMVSCSSIPKGAQAVNNFDLQKYLGSWYEIARLDFKYERNLNSTTALYTLNDDGMVKVTNRGYNYVTKEHQESIGKAKFRSSDVNKAELEVSFFGPFYAGYNVIEIDEDYQYALVAGASTKYLWILSRTKTIPESIKTAYLEKAQKIGYKIEDLVWVEQK